MGQMWTTFSYLRYRSETLLGLFLCNSLAWRPETINFYFRRSLVGGAIPEFSSLRSEEQVWGGRKSPKEISRTTSCFSSLPIQSFGGLAAWGWPETESRIRKSDPIRILPQRRRMFWKEANLGTCFHVVNWGLSRDAIKASESADSSLYVLFRRRKNQTTFCSKTNDEILHWHFRPASSDPPTCSAPSLSGWQGSATAQMPGRQKS